MYSFRTAVSLFVFAAMLSPIGLAEAGIIEINDLIYTVGASARNSVSYIAASDLQYATGPLVQQSFGSTLHNVTNFSQSAAANGVDPATPNIYSYVRSNANAALSITSTSDNIVGTLSAGDGAVTNFHVGNDTAIAQANGYSTADISFSVVDSPVLFFYYRRGDGFNAYPVSNNNLALSQNGNAIPLTSATSYYGHIGSDPGKSLFKEDFPDVTYTDIGYYYSDGREGYVAILQPGTGYHLNININALNGNFSIPGPYAQKGVTTFAFAPIPEISSFWMMGFVVSGVGFVAIRNRRKPDLSINR